VSGIKALAEPDGERGHCRSMSPTFIIVAILIAAGFGYLAYSGSKRGAKDYRGWQLPWLPSNAQPMTSDDVIKEMEAESGHGPKPRGNEPQGDRE